MAFPRIPKAALDNPDVYLKLVRELGAADAVTPAAVSAVGGQTVGKEVLGNLLANLITGGGAAALGALSGGATQALNAPVGAPVASRGKGGYFVSPADMLNLQQYVDKENFRRGLLGLPPLDASSMLSEQIGRAEQQAESLGRRERAKIGLEKGYGLAETGLLGQLGIEKTESQALGNIQQQKIKSGYEAASNLLETAIQEMYATPNFDKSPVLSELARAY